MKEPLHSSYALPVPNPRPTHAGHVRRLKRSTEKTTPNPRPSEERTSSEDKQRSHFSFKRASLTGLLCRATGAVADMEVSDIVKITYCIGNRRQLFDSKEAIDL